MQTWKRLHSVFLWAESNWLKVHMLECSPFPFEASFCLLFRKKIDSIEFLMHCRRISRGCTRYYIGWNSVFDIYVHTSSLPMFFDKYTACKLFHSLFDRCLCNKLFTVAFWQKRDRYRRSNKWGDAVAEAHWIHQLLWNATFWNDASGNARRWSVCTMKRTRSYLVFCCSFLTKHVADWAHWTSASI